MLLDWKCCCRVFLSESYVRYCWIYRVGWYCCWVVLFISYIRSCNLSIGLVLLCGLPLRIMQKIHGHDIIGCHPLSHIELMCVHIVLIYTWKGFPYVSLRLWFVMPQQMDQKLHGLLFFMFWFLLLPFCYILLLNQYPYQFNDHPWSHAVNIQFLIWFDLI